MNRIIRLTEEQLKQALGETIEDYDSLSNDMSYSQIRNETGIYDDEELNAAADHEDYEAYRDEVYNAIVEFCGGKDPRHSVVDFNGLCDMLKHRFNFDYTDYKKEDRGWSKYMFTDGKGNYLRIYNNGLLGRNPGEFTIDNFDVTPFEL